MRLVLTCNLPHSSYAHQMIESLQGECVDTCIGYQQATKDVQLLQQKRRLELEMTKCSLAILCMEKRTMALLG